MPLRIPRGLMSKKTEKFDTLCFHVDRFDMMAGYLDEATILSSAC